MLKKKKKGREEAYRACQHLLEYKSRQGLRGFRVVQKCLLLQSGFSWSVTSGKDETIQVPTCIACGKTSGKRRLYACLICADIHCNAHVHIHNRKPSHNISVDLDRAELYCGACNDQVYDPDFDTLVLCSTKRAITPTPQHDDKSNSMLKREQMGGERDGEIVNSGFNGLKWGCKKRRRIVEYRSWVPSNTEKSLIRQRATRLTCRESGSDEDFRPWGLRGLNNLGNTCFMNCVLQALLHTPPLRNYFLSDRHNRAFCQQLNGCISCDMDDIFSASFSGARTPYSPARFLYSWWQHAGNFAGYEQHDAHDFFISAVDGIHANHATASTKGIQSQCNAGSAQCRCIVHKVFSGVLRSDVTCTICNSTSTTYDPCLDLSLDLERSIVRKNNPPDSDCANLRGDLFLKGRVTGMSTLLGCLDKFTRPERLGSNEKIYCIHCQTQQESIKQMSVKKLPLVLSFHIKRFEHSTTQQTTKKVDRYMQFPFSLDMTPYMSSSIVRLRYGNRTLSVENDVEIPAVSEKMSSKFDLFAVVTHSGNMDSGHYVAFLRSGGKWYKCDDAWINQVSEEVVRASQGYMLYYIQKTFHYETK